MSYLAFLIALILAVAPAFARPTNLVFILTDN